MRGDREVVVLDDQVVYRHCRQVAPERLPVTPIVEAEPHAALGAYVQEPPSCRVLAYNMRELVPRDAGVDLRPRGAVVGGLEKIRLVVVHQLTVAGEVRSARRDGRRI